jgi:hypothetical protein
MTNITRNFITGRMNKVFDERLVPNGEYIDAMNIRMGSTEMSEIGVIENTKGNEGLTSLTYIDGTALSANAKCIGAYQDGEASTLYWFVHDPDFPVGATGKLDLVVSFNTNTNILTYHIVSINDGNNVDTTLNFNSDYLITGINLIKTGTTTENLLFWTDDYNPPRFINITRGYSVPLSNIDTITSEDILVIKRPPIESPGIRPYVTNGQENFMETRFLCFAYRYQYADNEYSATSQFTEPSFTPQPFNFSINSYLNEGMINQTNAVEVTFNTGGPLVKSIDLLFKEADSNVIKVIEKLNKQELGYVDNQDINYQFSNSKIFTILPDSEILRLYDNVPLQAKAQTIMGNRLMFANYVEGYDLVDNDGNDVMFEYYPTVVTAEIGSTPMVSGTGTATYVINGSQTVADSILQITLAGLTLSKGSAISFTFTFTHALFTGSLPFPSAQTNDVTISFSYVLVKNYTSAYEFASSPEFQNAVGTSTNIQPIANACNGTTFTDKFNCSVPQQLSTYLKYGSGISALGQPIYVVTTPATSTVGFVMPVVAYVDDLVAPTYTAYEYYYINGIEANFQEISNPLSLHSNRGYEIGIVYMDDYNRATTALVSNNNTLFVPCANSALQNMAYVNIPPTQKPPYWATRYKFVIKPDTALYETIYTLIFFIDPNSNNAYFLLEGENARKVSQGDRLIVKADSVGATQQCTFATVLEKESKTQNFITVYSQVDPNIQIQVPSGVYMKINPSNFNVQIDDNAIVSQGTYNVNEDDGGVSPRLQYPMNIKNPATGMWDDYTVPAGSRIRLSFKFTRNGTGDGNNSCEKRKYTVDTTLISSKNYDSMIDWWNGDNVGIVVENGVGVAGGNNCTPEGEYIGSLASPTGIPSSLCTNYFGWYRNPSTNELVLVMTGTFACDDWFRDGTTSSIQATVEVFRATNLLIFETEPKDANPDIFYENNLSLPITNGFHEGNIQNQTSSLDAIINTGFANCYSFGNGAESYKIRDSIIGKSFDFGNRVTAVASQDYRRIDRFADITYSGVYYDESNTNRLNEFNLGLLNFKQCEDAFGPIQLLDARETDVLVLQEDKISYVLAGKNLLSDAAGGSTLTSVPEVLGTQIARTEKYGISYHPESYVHWGYDRYFTDAKRGAVIQLRGNSYTNDQLKLVSEQGMRTWFRDLFISSFNTQKLGGYDPYMNEYVLTSNAIEIPQPIQCLSCGVSQTFSLTNDAVSYCVNLGEYVGDVDIEYTVLSISAGGSFVIDAVYNSVTYTTNSVNVSGVLTFNKGVNNVKQTEITITSSGSVVLAVNVGCPNQISLTVIEIVVTNNSDSGQTNHIQYRYENGSYVSPLQTSFVTFASGTSIPLVSYYGATTGAQGFGSIPINNSDVYMYSNKIPPDTFNFDLTTDKLKYYTSNTLYDNNIIDVDAVISLASDATPITQSGNIAQANFNCGTLQDYLYLIWDYRAASQVFLCHSGVSEQDVCCNCIALTPYFLNGPNLTSATAIFLDANMTTCAPDGYYSDSVIVRQLVSCSLLPQNTCPSCAHNCPAVGVTGTGQGYFILDVDMGSSIGAIGVILAPGNGPIGMIAMYNGLIYNSVSSDTFGYLASGASAEPIYVGDTAYNCGIIPNSPWSNIPVLYWNGLTGYNPGITTTNVTVVPASTQLTPGAPGLCHLVIPKTSATPSTVRIICISLCVSASPFTIGISCPSNLTSFSSSGTQSDAFNACGGSVSQTYYVNYVNGSGGTLGYYDLVFQDVNGQFPLPDGYYHAPSACPPPYNWFRVENGVIVLFGTCEYGSNYVLQNCASAATVVASYVGPVIPLGTFVVTAGSPSCGWTVVSYTGASATDSIASIPPGVTCNDVCGTYTGVNTTNLIIGVQYTICGGAIQFVTVNPGYAFNACAEIGSIIITPPLMTITSIACC